MKKVIAVALTIVIISLAAGSVFAQSANQSHKTKAQTSQPASKISINKASASELMVLPRVGEKIAQRIIDYRTKNGGFKTLEELMNVKGIGDKTFARLKDKITL